MSTGSGLERSFGGVSTLTPLQMYYLKLRYATIFLKKFLRKFIFDLGRRDETGVNRPFSGDLRAVLPIGVKM
jgi:hypothetical protein